MQNEKEEKDINFSDSLLKQSQVFFRIETLFLQHPRVQLLKTIFF